MVKKRTAVLIDAKYLQLIGQEFRKKGYLNGNYCIYQFFNIIVINFYCRIINVI